MSGEYGTTHRAIVRAVVATGVIVEIPALAPNAAWGPIPTCVPNLAVDEAVLVTQISTSRDTLVVVGRVPGRAPTVAEILTLAATLAALQAADAALDIRLDTAEADIVALEAVDVALDGRLDTAEATLAAHTHTTAPSMAVTGAVTVGTTLGVTGATTLAALAATVAAISGAVSAHSAAAFSEQLEAAAHGVWSTKIRVKDTTVHNRSTRQPVVHHEFAAAVSVTVSTSLTHLDSFTWVQKETGNVKMECVVIGAAINGTAGNAAQVRLRWRLVAVTGSVQLAEQDFFFLSAHVDPAGTGMINSATMLGAPNILLTAGTSYRFEAHAVEDAAFGHDMFIRDISWIVTECVRAT